MRAARGWRPSGAKSGAVPELHYEVYGPPGGGVVQAWADDYIRFDNLPVWQRKLRDEIRGRCQALVPSPDEVLHATLCGAKRPNADIENLLLYNIGSFKVAGVNGIRFEHGAGVPTAPGGAEYAFGYRYALARRSEAFAHWQQGRELASFDGIDLGAFAGEKKLAQVWLALSAGRSRCPRRRHRGRRSPCGCRSGHRAGSHRCGAGWSKVSSTG